MDKHCNRMDSSTLVCVYYKAFKKRFENLAKIGLFIQKHRQKSEDNVTFHLPLLLLRK